MTRLTAAVRARWPGVVVYGVGDEPHRRRISDHNEDDTPGSRAAQTDQDRVPEHRALDIMVGPTFRRADGYALVEALVRDQRVWYVIFDGHLWSATYGWKRRPHTDDPHTDHVHVSGLASQDENTAAWPRVEKGDVMAVTPQDAQAIEREIMTNGAMVQLFYRTEAILANRPKVTYPDGRAETNALASELDRLADAVAALAAKVNALAGTERAD